MKSIRLILMVLLLASMFAGCASPGEKEEQGAAVPGALTAENAPVGGSSNRPDEEAEVPPPEHTNLAYYMVIVPQNQAGWQPQSEGEVSRMRDLPDDEVLLFVNGSAAEERAAVRVGQSILYALDRIASMLGMTAPAELPSDVRENEVVIEGERYLNGDALASLLGCRITVWDGASAAESYAGEDMGTASGCMIPGSDLEQVLITRLPAGGKTAEECLAYLREGLIRAYAARFGVPFEPYEGERPGDIFSPDYARDSARWTITGLSVGGENDRFVIVPAAAFTRIFYVDRFTDDVFAFYPGYGYTFMPYDFDSPGALFFAG